MPIDNTWARTTALQMIERDILDILRSPFPNACFGEGVRQTALALNLITDREEVEYGSSASAAVEYRRTELRERKNARLIGRATP